MVSFYNLAQEKILKLQDLINYDFKNQNLLIEALSHPSLKQISNIHLKTPNYERLELLGDSILSFVITEYLFINFTDHDEGKLAKIRANLICKDMLCRVAAKLDLADFIIMTLGEELSGGRTNPNNIENTLEAIIAAIYLDSNMGRVKEVILDLWQEFFKGEEISYTDPKSALQEWAQSRGYEKPIYEVVEKSGPAHLPSFIISVTLENWEAKAEGQAIKTAEKLAAKKLLEILEPKKE